MRSSSLFPSGAPAVFLLFASTAIENAKSSVSLVRFRFFAFAPAPQQHLKHFEKRLYIGAQQPGASRFLLPGIFSMIAFSIVAATRPILIGSTTPVRENA